MFLVQIVLIINASFVQALFLDLVDLQAIDSTGKIIK